MKTKKLLFTIIIFATVCILACSKESIINSNNDNDPALSSSQSANVVSVCDQFAYADTIFYPAELPDDYIIHLNTPLSGSFGTYPDGLEMNPLNGDIDITESETGLKYLIWYVPAGTHDTCKKFLTVAGINFTDSIYTLKNNPGIATPMYNATPLLPTDCNGNCEFDDGHDDDDGDGFADEPPLGQEVIPQGISMDKASGSINLRQSIRNGALGPNPTAGAVKDFVLNYRISDRSSKALNNTTLRIYYYKTQSQIPAKLKRDLAAKKQQILLNNATNPATVSYTVNTTTTNKHGAGEVKCRPPYIIVVQQ
jgi:hypothetical protein